MEGVVTMRKDPDVAFEPDDPCYWNGDKEHVTESCSGGTYIGRSRDRAALGDRKLVVRIGTGVTIKTTDRFTVLTPGHSVSQSSPLPSVSLLELKEFCYARTLIGEVYGLQHDAELMGDSELRRLIAALRDMLRCHRFDVFAWLMQQGVAIPAALIADATHLTVGNQSPDRPVHVAPPAS